MQNWFRLACIGAAASAALTACTMQNASVPPEQLMSKLQAGEPVLDCQAACILAWGSNRSQAAVLDATGRWQDLALLVMRIGYLTDLSYYYLGRAAENLGYLQPAQKYYRIAERISATDMSCHQIQINTENMANTLGLNSGSAVDVCSGYVFPDVLYPHLQVVESRLAALSAPAAPTRSYRRRVAPKSSSPASTAATQGGSGFVEPAPTATPAPPSGSGFVEPAPTSSDPFAIPPVRR